MKTCTKCNVEKDIDLFPANKRTKDLKCSWCRSCHAEITRLYRHNNKDKIKQTVKERNQREDVKTKTKAREELNKEKRKLQARFATIKRKYGITQEEYEFLEKQQNYRCKICGVFSKDNIHGYLYVDHCHSSNKIRSLLCQKCNSLLGYSKDRIDILEKAIEYLREHQIEEKT